MLEREAKAWWRDAALWAGKDKDDIDVAVGAFEKMWPAPSAAPKKQHKKMVEFDALILSNEVGRTHLDSLGAESPRHVWFVKELMKKAFAVGDSDMKNLMLPQAIAHIPSRLTKAIGDSFVDTQTWAD
ncbi:hypothetical protein K438DRAFT_1963010 [Mycena galopus ATCC 62051]|nr:hypothetical protein K438DRAFT_1963010 [Mycena galopus ATCC 62051]